MKVFWKDGALNLKPETEEDGHVTSAILFAFGTEKSESHLLQRILEVGSDSVSDGADHKTVIGVNMPLHRFVQGVDLIPLSERS